MIAKNIEINEFNEENTNEVERTHATLQESL